MKLTSSEANKLLEQLKEEQNHIYSEECVVSTFKAATVENIEDARPTFDYDKTKADLELLNRKIRSLKHAINVFNTTTTVEGFDMTVDEMLVYLPQLTRRISRLEVMSQTLPKSRIESSSNRNFIEYEYANFDIAKAKEDYTAAVQLKAKAQTALDLLNNTVQLDVEI